MFWVRNYCYINRKRQTNPSASCLLILTCYLVLPSILFTVGKKKTFKYVLICTELKITQGKTKQYGFLAASKWKLDQYYFQFLSYIVETWVPTTATSGTKEQCRHWELRSLVAKAMSDFSLRIPSLLSLFGSSQGQSCNMTISGIVRIFSVWIHS